jgi:hypothetical protein
MTRTERANAVLDRLGSPVEVSETSDTVEFVLAAVEAIETRLEAIDKHLQHRTLSEIQRDWDYLADLAGITQQFPQEPEMPSKTITLPANKDKPE